MDLPLVSVYLTTYNRVKLLQRAVNSVIAQSYKNIELIIVDDGSTDGTIEYLDELTHRYSMIKVIRKNKQNMLKGASASRNIAIRHSRGKFVTGLDDDDYFHKDRVQILMNNYDPKYSCVSSNYFKMCRFTTRSSFVRRVISLNDLFNGNFIGSQVLVERERIIKAGLFDESLKASQDLDMWIRLVKIYGNALRISKPLYYMDMSHEGQRISTSSSRRIGTEQFLTKYKDEMTFGQYEYKRDSLGEKKNKLEKIFNIKKYGFQIFFNLVRSKFFLS